MPIAPPPREDVPTPPSPLRLVRLRLRLGLITMAIVPTAISMALINALITPMAHGPGLFVLAMMGALMLLLTAITVWMSRQILKPAEDLDRSRTDLKNMYEVARADSLRDGLTGLGNHRAFQEELDRELEWYQRYKVPVALLLIDVDDLRLVNDSSGHVGGDEILRDMGALIAESGRYADRAFRIGGDEFAILMPHTDVDGALHLARRLQERALQPRRGSRQIQFSGGVSACPTLATTRSQLYAQADAALHWCKRHGRASIDVFDPVRDQAANQEASNALTAAIAKVVTDRLIRPVYQPIVDLATGRVMGFEGLSRPTAESGFADPASMFNAAEAVGRTVELDLSCLHAVIAGARHMPADQMLSINISPRTLEAPHFSAEALTTLLGRYSIAVDRVVVELTERETVEDLNRLQANLGALQRLGLRVAADDVGAGNAGLRLLSQIRFDIVKIDLSIVQEGTERDSSRAVLRSLRELAARWQADVIAEGLETASQLRLVRELGISAGQGYLLARPMPEPNLRTVDVAALEAGGMVLSRPMPLGERLLNAPAVGPN
ncbi:MAG: EAL domain-containing protein [Chloroflexota bacterium]